jgi:hypothetical protein
LSSYPVELGYFSDCPSALDLLDWCGLPLADHLDSMVAIESLSAAGHLADLVDAVFTRRNPFETAPRAIVLTILLHLQTGYATAHFGDGRIVTRFMAETPIEDLPESPPTTTASGPTSNRPRAFGSHRAMFAGVISVLLVPNRPSGQLNHHR